MTEKAKKFHPSFNDDFCVHLEFHLCRTFEHSEEEEKGLSLVDCLPAYDSMAWIDIDIENKTVEVRLP